MLLILEPQKSCESWVGTQQIRVNCYRAFHSADQVQDHNALLKSMHMQRGDLLAWSLESQFLSASVATMTATEHHLLCTPMLHL